MISLHNQPNHQNIIPKSQNRTNNQKFQNQNHRPKEDKHNGKTHKEHEPITESIAASNDKNGGSIGKESV